MSRSPAVKIREYHVKDFPALCHLVAEFFSYHRELNGRGPLPPDEAATLIPRDMLKETSKILVAEPTENGDIIGFCRVELHEGAYFLRELGVTSSWRIRGVGTALLRSAEEHIKTAGQSNLYLSVVPRNVDALRFFVRRGYDIINTIELRANVTEDRVQRTPTLLLGLQFRY
ncbi:MAG: GNAT family N-acetyltransferase [Candidatus Hodarchaeota archaeon]